MAKIELFPLSIGHSCTTLWVKNLLEIALSLTVFEIFKLFHFHKLFHKLQGQKFKSFGGISDLLNVEIKKFQSSYYSVSYGLTALKIHHDTVHQKVGEQLI